MITQAVLLANVMTGLQTSGLCHAVKVLQTESFSSDQFAFKVRKEHFLELSTQPHHFHNENGQVEVSPLTGDPPNDLPIVLEKVRQFLKQQQQQQQEGVLDQ